MSVMSSSFMEDMATQNDRGFFVMDANPRVPLIRKHPKKKIVICNQGFLYNIRIPRDELNVQTFSLTPSEHERILANATGPSIIERDLEVFKKTARKKKEDIKAAEERKRQIIEKNLFAVRVEEDNEQQARRKARDRYHRIREKGMMENDCQIKNLDRWILNSRIQTERDKQLLWKKHCESVEDTREKAEFDRVLKCTQGALLKHEEREKLRFADAHHHLEGIKEQVREREQAILARRREKQNELSNEQDKIEDKCQMLTEFKEERLKELKACGIPAKYCRFVRRKTKEDEANPSQYQYRAYDTYEQLPRWTTCGVKANTTQEEPQSLNPFPLLPPITTKDTPEVDTN